MNVLIALRPKNMSIRERAMSSTGQPVTTYVFNGKEYTHIGVWPPCTVSIGFHVPIVSAYGVETGRNVTKHVKRFAGPRHCVSDESVRYALGTWSWRIQWRIWGCSTVPFLTVPEHVEPVCVIDALGHASVFCAK